MRITPTLILVLILARSAFANPETQGVTERSVMELTFTDQTIDTNGSTTTNSYDVGADRSITVDLLFSNASIGATVTMTPTWEKPGGNLAGGPVEALTTQAFTWTQGVDLPSFFKEFTPPAGASKMYLQALTSDTNGVSCSAEPAGR